ncbi:hypothetical protein J7M00_02090 [bacterium]|nr:hypothetical protein [bacterium]
MDEKDSSEKVNEEIVEDEEFSDGVDDFEDIQQRLETVERLLVQERNRRVFERAAEKSGVRYDRIDAAMKLAGIDEIEKTLKDEDAEKIVKRIVSEYPEFAKKQNPLDVDNGAPGVRLSRVAASGDALEMLKMLRKK